MNRSNGARVWPLALPALVAATVLVLGSLRLVTNVCGVFLDDGIYVATARAIAEGDGYRLINLPDSPPQTKYPLLYPALLATLWKIRPQFPANLLALQWLSLACAAGAVALGYLYLVGRGYGTSTECFIASMICATSPTFLYFATQTLSEPLFALLLVLSLWSVETVSARRAPGGAPPFIAGVVSTLPFLCRSLGACVPAVALFHMHHRSVPLRMATIGVLLTASPWILWLVFNWMTHDVSGVLSYYTADNYFEWWFADESFWRVPAMNLGWLALSAVILPIPIVGIPEIGVAWPLLIGAGLLVWRELLGDRFRSLLGATVIVYVVIVVAWPWQPSRFLVPLMPILTLLFVLAAKRCRWMVPGRAVGAVALAAAIVAVSANVRQHARVVRVIRATGYPYMTPPERPVYWRDYETLFNWIRTSTPPDATIASGLDSMIFLYTGRQGFRPFVQHPTRLFYGAGGAPLGTADEFAGILQALRPQYLVEMPMPHFGEEKAFGDLIRETRTRWPECLQSLRRLDVEPPFVLYAVHSDRCAPRG